MRSHHLHDDRLLDHYAAERTGGPLDPPTAAHLTSCIECLTRYEELRNMLLSVPLEAAAEADEVFTADRLKRQQQQILRRIEHLGHPARVISFPRLGRSIGGGTLRVAPRWLAAAAAAGLFVGVAVGGAFFDGGFKRVARSSRSTVGQAKATHLPPSGTGLAGIQPVVREADDDAFLSDLELALESPRSGELVPLDALTPHLRGISNQLR